MRDVRTADLGDSASLPSDLLSLRPRAVWRAFRAEQWAFIALCIYLLLEYLRPESAYPMFGVVPLRRFSWMATLIFVWFDRSAKLPNSRMNWLLVVFLLQCTISSYLAYRPDYSFDNFSTISMWVLIYFLIIAIVTTEKRLFLFFVIYLLANLKMSQFGFFSWIKRGFGFERWGLSGAGWFSNSGELGLEMAMLFAYTACLVGLLRGHWTGWRKWVMYFLPVSAFACVIASSSRGALAGLAAAIAYLLAFSQRRIRTLLALAPLVVFGYLAIPRQFLDRFYAAGSDPTSLARIHYWAKAKEMLNQHPFFGVGYYNWIPYYRDHYFDPSLYWRVEEAHNTFWQIGAELGYIGFGLFIAMIFGSFLINWQSERQSRRPGFVFLRALSIGMNAAGLALVVGSFFLTAFFLPNYWIHFALSVALAAVVKRAAHRADSSNSVGNLHSDYVPNAS